jgi:hypothetical protein
MPEMDLGGRIVQIGAEARVWVVAHAWQAAALGLLLLLALFGLASIWAANRRRAEILRAVDDSTNGRLTIERRLGWHGVRATIQPTPDPFASFTVECSMVGRGGRLGLLSSLLGGRSQRLVFYGMLQRRPHAEVMWERGRTPERALGRGPETSLWRAHRLDFLSGAYAVQGTNTAVLEHAFIDLQTRFGAYTQRVVVQANTNPQLVVALVANGMNREDIPALVTTVRSLARAALIE